MAAAAFSINRMGGSIADRHSASELRGVEPNSS